MIHPSKISFDKSNQLFSYFLKAIEIVHSHGGRIRRLWDFDAEMAAFCGSPTPKKPDGTENRAWYNKSIFPRYYGFLDLRHTTKDASGDEILSTPRGERLLKLAKYEEDLVNDPNNERSYYVPVSARAEAYALFAEAFRFGSFGRQNTGAELSRSDIDPPKVMMRLLHELSEATKEEICYCIYSLHRNAHVSIEDAISKIKHNRKAAGFSYRATLKKWGIENITDDFKLGKLLADPGLELLDCRHDQPSGHDVFSINNRVPKDIVEILSGTDGFYRPLKWIVSAGADIKYFKEWVRNVVAGSCHDDESVFYDDLRGNGFSVIRSRTFADAIVSAYSHPERNIYFALTASDESQIRAELSSYMALLDRTDDVAQDYNGWSLQAVEDGAIYTKLMLACSKFRGPDGRKLSQILPSGKIVLPANFHFIGGVEHA